MYRVIYQNEQGETVFHLSRCINQKQARSEAARLRKELGKRAKVQVLFCGW